MKSEPDMSALPAEVPAGLRSAVTRCLTKDPQQRVRDIGDVTLAMEGAFETVGLPSSPVAGPELKAWQRPLPAAALVVILCLTVWILKPAPPLEPTFRFTFAVSVPPSVPVAAEGTNNEVAITPDGTTVVYRGASGLQVRNVGQLQGVSLGDTGSVGANPFVSPDGAWIGFTTGGALHRVSIQGGPPVTICDLPGPLRGASWGDGRCHRVCRTRTGSLSRAGCWWRNWKRSRMVTTGGRTCCRGAATFCSRSGEAGARQVRLLDLETRGHEVIIPSGTGATLLSERTHSLRASGYAAGGGL